MAISRCEFVKLWTPVVGAGEGGDPRQPCRSMLSVKKKYCGVTGYILDG